ncbi:hypothetical protein AK812_SmicGene48706, partial [Symbiodinium microadriaticum]
KRLRGGCGCASLRAGRGFTRRSSSEASLPLLWWPATEARR